MRYGNLRALFKGLVIIALLRCLILSYSKTLLAADPRDRVINEIAWMGAGAFRLLPPNGSSQQFVEVSPQSHQDDLDQLESAMGRGLGLCFGLAHFNEFLQTKLDQRLIGQALIIGDLLEIGDQALGQAQADRARASHRIDLDVGLDELHLVVQGAVRGPELLLLFLRLEIRDRLLFHFATSLSGFLIERALLTAHVAGADRADDAKTPVLKRDEQIQKVYTIRGPGTSLPRKGSLPQGVIGKEEVENLLVVVLESADVLEPRVVVKV